MFKRLSKKQIFNFSIVALFFLSGCGGDSSSTKPASTEVKEPTILFSDIKDNRVVLNIGDLTTVRTVIRNVDLNQYNINDIVLTEIPKDQSQDVMSYITYTSYSEIEKDATVMDIIVEATNIGSSIIEIIALNNLETDKSLRSINAVKKDLKIDVLFDEDLLNADVVLEENAIVDAIYPGGTDQEDTTVPTPDQSIIQKWVCSPNTINEVVYTYCLRLIDDECDGQVATIMDTELKYFQNVDDSLLIDLEISRFNDQWEEDKVDSIINVYDVIKIADENGVPLDYIEIIPEGKIKFNDTSYSIENYSATGTVFALESLDISNKYALKVDMGVCELNFELNSSKSDEYSDDDGDGVINRLDHCPDTRKNVGVDERGCENDSDGDGVLNELDECSGHPLSDKFGEQITFDAVGCPADSDKDGIADYLDECEATPLSGLDGRAVEVDEVGCPVDTDGDGWADYLDDCPEVPGEVEGCPDSDGDGVADKDDECYLEVGTLKANGCPDEDDDGVPDKDDQCLGTPAGKVVDKYGCELKGPQTGGNIGEINTGDLEKIEDADACTLKNGYKVLNNSINDTRGASDGLVYFRASTSYTLGFYYKPPENIGVGSGVEQLDYTVGGTRLFTLKVDTQVIDGSEFFIKDSKTNSCYRGQFPSQSRTLPINRGLRLVRPQ